MTLSQLRAARPDRFYAQDWFEGHAFMQRQPQALTLPIRVASKPNGITASAVDLAALYLRHPNDEIWKSFLWTSDADDWGQRVYVGGVGQHGIAGFQIHRHLAITEQWGWPIWDQSMS